jgi:hypothetical protein
MGQIYSLSLSSTNGAQLTVVSSRSWLTPWSPKTKMAVVLAQFGFAGDEQGLCGCCRL